MASPPRESDRQLKRENMMRTALITGASSDIGLAVCRRYLSAGWAVIAHFRTPRPELDALASSALSLWRCDFADPDLLKRELAQSAARLSSADALIYLAAETAPGPLDEVDEATVIRALRVNTFPAFWLMRLLGPAMARRGFGRIVLGGSIGVKFGGGRQTFSYGLTKHALEFIPAEARGWAAHNVFVNTVRIGVTDTRIHTGIPGRSLPERVKLIPAGRAATPGEIAEALYGLGSELNTYISGEVIPVAGGE